MDEKIKLDASAPEPEKIAIRPDPAPPVADEQVLGPRVNKYDFALAESSPGAPEIRSALLQGREQNLREQGAIQEQIRLQDTRVNLVKDVFRKANEAGRTLSKAEEQTIMGLTQADIQEASVDPNTFFEKKYAQRVMDTAIALGEKNPFTEAAEVDDKAFFQKKHFEDILTKKEIAQRLFDDAGKDSKNQSWAGYIADVAKELIPFYTWSKMGNLDQKGANPALPGDDLRETIRQLHSLPPSEMAREARAIYNRLNKDNTPLAKEFAAALVGYTHSQQFWDNVLIAGVDIASLVPLGMLTKSAKGVKALGKTAATEGVKAAGQQAADATTKTLERSRTMLANFTYAMMKPRAGLDTALDQMGQPTKAALVDQYKQLREMGVGSKANSWDAMTKSIPSLFNVAEMTSVGGNYLTKKAAESIRANLQAGASQLLQGLLIDPIRSIRLDGVLLDVATREVVEDIELKLTNVHHSILDARIVDQDGRLGTTTFAEVDIAKRGGELFDTMGQADIHAKIDYGLVPGSYKINERGNKYYVTITRPVNETSATFRQALKEIATTSPATPGNRLAEWAMRWRTPDDTLPDAIVRSLSTSTYGQAAMKKTLEDFINDIPKLGKDDDVFKLMKAQQAERNRVDPTREGNGSETLAEFEYDFFSKFKQNPTPQQTEAYFKLRQLNDIVYAATNITQFMERSRAGVSLWSFDHGDFIEGGIRNIEGRMVKDIPWGHPHNFGILVLKEGANGTVEAPTIVASLGAGAKRKKEKATKFDPELLKQLGQSRMKKAEREDVVAQAVDVLARPEESLPSKRDEIKQLLNEGYQIIQVSSQGSRDLANSSIKGLTSEKPAIHFVIAKRHRQEPLGFDILPYREGFRFAPPDSALFLRQAIVKTDKFGGIFTYYGDRNLYQLDSPKDAEVMRDRFETARKLYLKAYNGGKAAEGIDEGILEVVNSVKALKPKSLKELDLTEFNEYVKHNLPAGVKNLAKQFWKGGENGEGIDPNSPILFSPTNQSLDRAHKLGEVLNREHGVTYNYTRIKDNDLDIYENTVSLQGAMERGDHLWKIGNKGSVHNPIYEVTRADIIDPLDSIEQMAKAFIRTASMRDLTFQMAERYIAEFSDVLDPQLLRLHADPIQTLLDDDLFKTGLKGDQIARAKQAKNYQERAKAFLGIRSDSQIEFAQMVDKLLGDIDARFGQGYLYNAADWLLKKKDPVTRLRTLAFHAKIGMLNFRQMILQPMTLASMAGVVGDMKVVDMTAHAIWKMGVLRDRHLPELIPAMEKELMKSGWKKGWFSEAADLLKRSGFDEVNQTHALISDHLDFDLLKNRFERGLNHASYFFQRGEKMVRHGAMMGAYLEWRTANPLAKLTDLQRAKILKRADLLNMNMSHASRAKWQEGIMSIPTQFLAYPIRTFEQMIGKRLTWQEKARIVAVHSAAFGVPVALSGAMPLYPTHDLLRQEFLDNGVDVNANVIGTIINDGFLGMIAEAVAGEPTNFSERFGPTGIPTIKDLWDGDKTPLEILQGASGSTFMGLIAGVAPVVPWMWDAIMPGSDAAPVSLKAIRDATIGHITTWSNIEKAWMAVSSGAYMSKQGVRIDGDVNHIQTFLGAFTGHNVKRIDMMYDLQTITKARQDVQKKLRPAMLRDLRSTLASSNVGDATASITDFKARAIAGGFSPSQVKDMVRDELKGKESLWDAMKNFSTIDQEKNDFVRAMRNKYKGTAQ